MHMFVSILDINLQASQRGSDHVMVRSEFVVQLPQLLQQYSQLNDPGSHAR